MPKLTTESKAIKCIECECKYFIDLNGEIFDNPFCMRAKTDLKMVDVCLTWREY